MSSKQNDICNHPQYSGGNLRLEDLALNVVLDLKIASGSLHSLFPKNLYFFAKCGQILDVLNKGDLFELVDFTDCYKDTWKDSLHVATSSPVKLALRRNLLRNLHSITECIITKKDFLVQFKHFNSLPICSSSTTLPCHNENAHYGNSLNNNLFTSFIKTTSPGGFERIIKRIVDFPINKRQLCVRIRYCLERDSPYYLRHYDFSLTLKKSDRSDQINLSKRSCKTLATIELLQPLESCADEALRDFPLEQIL